MIRLEREGARTWTLASAAQKLLLRDGLPGAFCFDRAARALAHVAASGTKRSDLLPFAFASSWFVNNRAPSTVYRRWLEPPLVQVWIELTALLEGGTRAWLDLDAEERATVAAGVRTLAADGHGVGAMSKPLAMLAPDAVPLMPDAAIAFARGTVAMPPLDKADTQSASIDEFSPMMTWFAEAVAAASPELAPIANEHEATTGIRLSPAQVLDRLLWFDSIGHRHFRKEGAWWWIRDDEGEAVVHVSAPFSGAPSPDGPIDLGREDAGAAWREEARAELARARRMSS